MTQSRRSGSAGLPQDEPMASSAPPLARWISLVFTWGMPDGERQEALAESTAYWEAMAADHSALYVALRALLGIPGWIWTRLSARDTTTLPAALGFGLIALGGLTAILQPEGFSVRTRWLMVIGTIGFTLGTVALIRTPRKLVLRRFGLPGLLTAIGTIGIALDLPEITAFADGSPTLDNPYLNSATALSLLSLGIGSAVGAINAVARNRLAAVVAGGFVVLGLIGIGATQIVFGIWDTSHHLGLAIASIMTGLAAFSLVHVMPRMRHLEVE